MAERKGKKLEDASTSSSDGGDWQTLLNPSERQRLEGYQALCLERGVAGVVNYGQNPSFHSGVGELIPSLLRGSTLFSFRWGRKNVDSFSASVLVKLLTTVVPPEACEWVGVFPVQGERGQLRQSRAVAPRGKTCIGCCLQRSIGWCSAGPCLY